MIRKISEKRLKKGERLAWNSTIKAKSYTLKKSPIRKVSKKAASLWAEARNKVIKRDGENCIICGKNKGLHCHHFQFKRTKKPQYKYDIDNLCILCDNCHRKAHEDEESYNEYKNKILRKFYERGTSIRNLENIPEV